MNIPPHLGVFLNSYSVTSGQVVHKGRRRGAEGVGRDQLYVPRWARRIREEDGLEIPNAQPHVVSSQAICRSLIPPVVADRLRRDYRSDDNVYAKQNGGKYNFFVEPQAPKGPGHKSGPGESGLSIPDDQNLWDDLMTNKTEHEIPLVVYEQDWMYNEWQGLNVTQQSPTMGRDWLMQMGAGAAKSNVSVQYCMTFVSTKAVGRCLSCTVMF